LKKIQKKQTNYENRLSFYHAGVAAAPIFTL